MSQLSDFLAAVDNDESLQSSLQLKYAEATIKFAAEHGFSFSLEEYISSLSVDDEQVEQELRLEELKEVSGGNMRNLLGQIQQSSPRTMAMGEDGRGCWSMPSG
jgi:predicted ribosomally synthesized peptide with nif11-like leader